MTSPLRFRRPLPQRAVRLLGLTGGIGSGKSTAARFFREAGATVIDADILARRAVQPGQPALEEIRQSFGEAVIRDDGTLDREMLGRLAFSDVEVRARLNAIVHPRVQAMAEREIAEALAASPDGLVVYDVPLLFETGAEARVDLVAVVYAPAEVQERRLQRRDGMDAEAIRARLRSQDDIEEKARRADVVLDNGGTPEDLRRQVMELVEQLSARNRVFLH